MSRLLHYTGDIAGDVARRLAALPLFEGWSAAELRELAEGLDTTEYPAGETILRQGDASPAVYILLSGHLAVRVGRETIACLKPPDVFGELSYVTGRPNPADVEVIVEARVARFNHCGAHSRAVRERLQRMVLARLRAGARREQPAPVVLLDADAAWDAPRSFAAELTSALQRETGRPALLVDQLAEPATLSARLPEWKARFPNIVLAPPPGDPARIARQIAGLANWRGVLLGPGSPAPHGLDGAYFVVQSAERPTLPVLDGRRQLLADSAASEALYLQGRPVTAAFARTAASIARRIAGTQVGLALSGGAAWGWSHIGVLEVLEQAGIPVDMIAGCSMGAVIGALRCTGRPVEELLEIPKYWSTRTRRFLEWRLWRMSLLNERMVCRTFQRYFGDTAVNRMAIPFRVGAVDLESGQEEPQVDGPLWEALRASIALPGLLPPWRRGGRLLVDASVRDPLPVQMVRDMGADFAIAVNAIVPPGVRRPAARYPRNLHEIVVQSLSLMQRAIGQGAAEKAADIVFSPDLSGISLLEFRRSAEIVAAGRRAAEEKLPVIRALYEILTGSRPR